MLFRFLILFLCVFNMPSNDEVTLSWQASRKLSWTDFKGPIDTRSDAVAVTASGITFSFSVKQSNDRLVSFTSQVSAHFYPEKSWYIKEKGDDHILAHEQLHFDITELHVRLLRYKIAQLPMSQHIKEDLRRLHREANDELAKMQHVYDTQTNNSINKEQQKKWAQYVHSELERYSGYQSK